MKMLFRSALVASAVICLSTVAYAQGGAINPDVVYGHKDGLALTFDVLKPSGTPNGASILFVVSGGWNSRWQPASEVKTRWEPALKKGFTVFVVRHGSAPRYNAAEAFGDIQRAVRFIRLNAKTYGVDAERLGIHGGSAGGHLSLMVALNSDAGDPAQKDEVLRASSKVAAVVAYYPPVDLRTQTGSGGKFPAKTTESFFYGDGLAVARAQERWPALKLDEKERAAISPVMHVSPDDPPVLFVHGDADTVVDLSASQTLLAELQAKQVTADLHVIPGAAHVFPDEAHAARAMDALVAFFETHLARD
jgi:acetyl esterase/lipase